jgi:hypothetical protein
LYGWSLAYDPEFRKRFAKRNRLDKTNPVAESVLDAHLAAILERTRLFHQALDVPVAEFSPVSLLAFAGDCDATLNAPIIYYDNTRNRWVTMTSPKELRNSDGRKFAREEIIRAMYLPGDGRVTRASVMGENLEGSPQSPYQRSLPIIHAFFTCAGHGGLQNNRILQDNALSVLVRQGVK